MSINEPAGGRRRGGLTKQQKRQAEAALYGLEVKKEETNVPTEYSPKEIEQMRQLVRFYFYIDKTAQPALGNSHENCLRKRRSPSKNSRRSSMP